MKLTLVLLLVYAFSLSSCVQSYDCVCIVTEDGLVVQETTDTYAGTKKSTQKICDKFEEDLHNISSDDDAECTIR